METVKIRIPLIVTIPVSEQMAVEQMNAAINKLLKVGGLKGDPSDFILNYEVKNYDAENCVVVEINKEALVDTLHLQTVAGGLCLVDDDNFNWWDRKVQLPKTFSATTIKERLRVAKFNPRQKFRLVVNDYKKYWSQKGNSISEDEVRNLVSIFLSDLMQMFNDILPDIQEGKQLQSLLGTNTVSNSLNQAARDLSFAYRKALNQEQQQGAPSKQAYTTLSEKYKLFANALLIEVFPGIEKKLHKEEKPTEQNPVAEKQKETVTVHSYKRLSDGRIDLFEGHKVFTYNRLKDGRLDLFSNRTPREILNDKELQNRIFEELKKKWGEETFKRMTFYEIYTAVMKEFWKRKRFRKKVFPYSIIS